MSGKDQLTSAQLDEYKEAYLLFDKNGDGRVDAIELQQVLNSLGVFPKDDEVKDMVNEIDVHNTGSIEFDEFLALMSKKMKDSDTEEELVEAFRVFDKQFHGDVGYLFGRDIKMLMCTYGDKITEEEADELLREAELSDD